MLGRIMDDCAESDREKRARRLAEFVKGLAAVAGVFVWSVSDRGKILAEHVEAPVRFVPVTALYFAETGEMTSEYRALFSMGMLDIADELAQATLSPQSRAGAAHDLRHDILVAIGLAKD